MVGWHHRLNGHEFEQSPRDSEGQPGVLQSMGSQRVEHDLETKQQQQSSTKESRIYNGEKTFTLISDAGKTGRYMCKNEIINRIFSNTIYKNKLKMD